MLATTGQTNQHTPPLSALKVAKLTKPGRYGDGGNLWLQIADTGRKGDDGKGIVTKSWLFRYRLNGRARQMGLGPVELVTLADARNLAHDARRLLLRGKDPIEERDRQAKEEGERKRLETARSFTFQHCAESYIAAHQASWKNEKHRAQWKATLETYVYPEIGDLPVSAIDLALVLRILEPVWEAKPETASRVRGRLERVLDWCTVRGYRQGDNPARWKGHLAQLLPSRRKVRATKHHAAVPYKSLPDFMRELRAREGISARALEFTILTAARTGETIGAAWAEIDREGRIWTVPAERMKSGRPHRVPLSDPCLAILDVLPRFADSPYLFPGAWHGKHLSNMAMLELMRGMAPPYVPHGFRSSFKDWATEQTDHARDIVEAALAHVVGDRVEASYRRGDAIEKRRALMRAWADYCMQLSGRALPCVGT